MKGGFGPLFYLSLLLRTCTLSPDNKGQDCLLSKLLRKGEKQSRYMGVRCVTITNNKENDHGLPR
jgi:hypothetical protein